MATATKTISNTIDFCKRMSFDRNPVIGNSLEPALTASNIVMQTILGPPFSWWWNNEEVTINTSSILNATIAHAGNSYTVAGGVLTATVANSFSAGNLVMGSLFGTLTQLNGILFQILTASGTGFTANVPATITVFGATVDAAGIFTATTTQDYVLSLPEFSYIEHASVLDVTVTPNKWYELEVKNNLSLDSATARPRFLNPHMEDASGNVTFRVMPAPNQNYPVEIHIQKVAPLITSINQTWAPIPDFMSYVYTWGFLALIWHFADDSRAQLANQKFLAGLLGRAEGITEEERAIFLNNWEALTSLQTMKTQQGVQGRGV